MSDWSEEDRKRRRDLLGITDPLETAVSLAAFISVTHPSYLRLLEIEKAAKWYRAWSTANTRWIIGKGPFFSPTGVISPIWEQRFNKVSLKQLAAYERLLGLLE